MNGLKSITLLFTIFFTSVSCTNMQTYNIHQINEQPYGLQISSNITRTLTDCFVLCSERGPCRSVMYDDTSRVCNLNSAIIPVENMNCTNQPCITQPIVNYAIKSGVCISSIRTSCTSNTDCVDESSECRDGMCKCDAGLHHDPNTCSCVTSCTEYGRTFQMELGVFIPYENQESLYSIPDFECRHLCLQSTDYTCKTYEYRADIAHCRTAVVTSYTNATASNADTVLYTRDCVRI